MSRRYSLVFLEAAFTGGWEREHLARRLPDAIAESGTAGRSGTWIVRRYDTLRFHPQRRPRLAELVVDKINDDIQRNSVTANPGRHPQSQSIATTVDRDGHQTEGKTLTEPSGDCLARRATDGSPGCRSASGKTWVRDWHPETRTRYADVSA